MLLPALPGTCAHAADLMVQGSHLVPYGTTNAIHLRCTASTTTTPKGGRFVAGSVWLYAQPGTVS